MGRPSGSMRDAAQDSAVPAGYLRCCIGSLEVLSGGMARPSAEYQSFKSCVSAQAVGSVDAPGRLAAGKKSRHRRASAGIDSHAAQGGVGHGRHLDPLPGEVDAAAVVPLVIHGVFRMQRSEHPLRWWRPDKYPCGRCHGLRGSPRSTALAKASLLTCSPAGPWRSMKPFALVIAQDRAFIQHGGDDAAAPQLRRIHRAAGFRTVQTPDRRVSAPAS